MTGEKIDPALLIAAFGKDYKHTPEYKRMLERIDKGAPAPRTAKEAQQLAEERHASHGW